MTRPAGFLSVMQGRRSPPTSLDYFPTPPWASRAGLELVRSVDDRADLAVSEPACGGGHMAHVLAEDPELRVRASDVFDYGWGHDVADFLDDGWGFQGFCPDWIFTNPPFAVAERFVQLALARARRGVAILVRTAFLEGGKRHRGLFEPCPPRLVAIFSERVPMVAGRWDPKATTATSYCWILWRHHAPQVWGPEICWIPPGTRQRLTRPDDVERFADRPATEADAPLFDGAAP